ncbi:hypothetical protein TGS27_0234 [Geobacillus stearothermophilus]|uniref:Uncharacterized protein n=1 Tax=Geobacillus stearothermophilus TaxID=1422 RepID=A0ABQ7HDB4_GEOSE|nr:hypothetical protein GS8_2337 [Geobacillus stearothermophilus]OAO88531.1 hypothetical protein TGS27_0234 [Geobacillus stearothermophilus]
MDFHSAPPPTPILFALYPTDACFPISSFNTMYDDERPFMIKKSPAGRKRFRHAGLGN